MLSTPKGVNEYSRNHDPGTGTMTFRSFHQFSCGATPLAGDISLSKFEFPKDGF